MLTLEIGDRVALAEAALVCGRAAINAADLPAAKAAGFLFAVLCPPFEEAAAHARAKGLPAPDRAQHELALAGAKVLAASIGSGPKETQH